MSNEFAIDVEQSDDRSHVTVRGELDMSNAPELAGAIRAVPVGTTVIVDLSAVSFIDSSAIGALVSAGQAIAEGGGRLQIGPRSDMVARVLEMTGLAGGTSAFDVLEP